MARLDRFYTPNSNRGNMRYTDYFIHGYSVGSDYSLVQIGMCIGQDNVRNSPFKWNVSHLRGEVANQLRHMWATLMPETSFFSKLRKVFRLYRLLSIKKTKDFRRKELDVRAKLECATVSLHKDVIYDMGKQGKVEELKNALEGVESRKAWGATIRSRVRWNNVGNKCSADFFKSIK